MVKYSTEKRNFLSNLVLICEKFAGDRQAFLLKKHEQKRI